MVTSSPALADHVAAVAAELWRVRLPWAANPAEVLAALEGEAYLCCMSGAWAGGGTIIASEPLQVAAPHDDPFALLDDLPTLGHDRPVPGAVGGGWFGWLGYRLAAEVEHVPLASARPLALPEFHLAYYDHVIRQDAHGFWWFEALATPERWGELEERLEHARRLVGEALFLRDLAGDPVDAGARPGGQAPAVAPLQLRPEVAAHHLWAVAECRERIAAGEIFQANICLRYEGEYEGTATELLREVLDRGRGAGYAAAFETPEGGIVSLSPELFLRRQGRHVRTGPIKGTAARPADPALAEESLRRLRGSSKDAAEHVMIVDLMRNDVGRVCEYGSVTAPRRPAAEAQPGLWHLVSNVEGRLRPEVSDAELLRATFPPGSVTGAPKVQSLVVIAELEPTGREVYTGAIGYASPLAGLELSVAIRTLELADGRISLGVGGGIVADSDPDRELEETLVKARPVAAALGTSIAGPRRRVGST